MIHWQPLYPAAVYVLVGIAIFVLVIMAHRIGVSAKQRSWLVLAIRTAVMLGLLALLLNPIDQQETALPPRPPSVALLVDCSQSMSLGIGQTRIERVKQTIDSINGKLQGERPYQLDLYRFGQRLTKVPSFAELSATEDSSFLADALERLPARITKDTPRAVILFSDGAVSQRREEFDPAGIPADDTSMSDELAKIAGAYRDLKIPIHAMLPMQDDLLGDVAITQLVVPRKVAAGDQTTIRAVIEQHGFDQQRVLVSVRPANRPNATPLATLPITLSDGPTPCELVITADESLGELTLEIPVLDGEAVDANNRIPFQLANRDRKLKVLYMEGTAGQEFHWLQDALHEDPDIQCVSMVVNNQYASRPSLQRVDDRYRGFPATREELFEYDVVICSDISRAAFTPEQIDWTVELVSVRGGGFVMIGGHTSFGSGGWDRTPWEKLIAFDMTGRRDYLNQSFGVEVPTDAESHPIWRLLDDPEQNRAALKSMPSFSGTNLISRVKPAATLLGQTGSSLMRVGVMPVFACETYGRGRTFAMSTDTTLSWGQAFESRWGTGDNRYFRKFWRNVIRWLAENSRSSQHRLVVQTDQVIYGRDDPIQVVVEAYDKDLRMTTDYRVTAALIDKESAALDLAAPTATTLEVKSSLKRYTAAIESRLPDASDNLATPMQTGVLLVQAWDGNEEVARESLELQLLNDSKEWLRPQARPEILSSLAESGGGTLLQSESELLELLRSFDSSSGDKLIHELPLWDHTLIWMALIGALTIEWTIRRRGTNPS